MASTKGFLNEVYRQIYLAGPIVNKRALSYKWDDKKKQYVDWPEEPKPSDEEDIN
jgi:hypothetical protein